MSDYFRNKLDPRYKNNIWELKEELKKREEEENKK